MKLEKLNIEKLKEKGKNSLSKVKEISQKQASVLKETASTKAVAFKEVASTKASVLKKTLSTKAVTLKETVSTKYESSSLDLSFMKKVHFNFHHFITVCMIALLAFFVTFYTTGANTASVSASGLDTPKVTSYNKTALDINYGDSKAIASIAKDILNDKVSSIVDLKEISNSGATAVYDYGNYVVKIELENTSGIGEKSAKLEIQTKSTFAKSAAEKVVTTNQEKISDIVDGTVYTYNVKLNVLDNEAPSINLSEDDITLDDTEDFQLENCLSVTDNVDGIVSNYTVEGMPAKDGDKFASGKHIVTIRAKDAVGNESARELILRIYETEEAPVATATSNNSQASRYGASSGAAGYSGAGSVASAALAQLGVAQDCTALVTNALRAVGINYHGWPAGYLSLGTVVSAAEAQSGDLIYYADGGVGAAHIAVYIGNGQAVHGGYLGSTRIASAYMGSGPVFIRLR